MTELLLCGTGVREAGQGKEDNCEVMALPALRTFGGGARADGGPRKPALLLRVDCAGLSRRLCQSAIGGVDTFSPNLDPMVHLGSIPLQTVEFLAVLGGVVEEVSQKGAGLGNLCYPAHVFLLWLSSLFLFGERDQIGTLPSTRIPQRVLAKTKTNKYPIFN